ncbi:hypothetical protein AB833_16530 [Chromatiales bacterium (ex Bugula neritina AB1)]|nr:hypothetical protein AB833_16530 [Chromatiales bacterium (ex Bugula neritina AB1)]
MGEIWQQLALRSTGAESAVRNETIQSLWSGYGEIFRVSLTGADCNSLIVKHIDPGNPERHPRGWHTDFATQRKLRSYEVERYWYDHWNNRCRCSRLAKCYTTHTTGNQTWILLEDLDASGFPIRHQQLDFNTAVVCLKWLARFHAHHMQTEATGLWPIGTYWHLATRPDELRAMTDLKLQRYARQFDAALNQCKYTTLVHGDAKVANFCFSVDNKQVAAVDFQYVGQGCGMKDVAYFIGSCLDEQACELHAADLLDCYFAELSSCCDINEIDVRELETEWRAIYPIAWADFYRFLAGWMPAHPKIHRYTRQMTETAYKLVQQAQ